MMPIDSCDEIYPIYFFYFSIIQINRIEEIARTTRSKGTSALSFDLVIRLPSKFANLLYFEILG